MKHSFPLHRKLFVSHFVGILIVSSAIGFFIYTTALESLMEQLKNRLSSSAAMVGQNIDANELRDIRFERDVVKLDYLEALQALRDMRHSIEDIAYLYVMRKDADGKVLFVVDSDESAEQALPGRAYSSTTKELMLGFTERSADSELSTDSWGTFYSGYAPLMNGNGEFLVGIDMRVDQVQAKLVSIRNAGIVAIFASLVFSWLIAAWMSRHFKKPIDAMIAQVQAVGSGDFDQRLDMRRHDEMDSLLAAINDMTTDLQRAREDNMRLAESLEESFPEEKHLF